MRPIGKYPEPTAVHDCGVAEDACEITRSGRDKRLVFVTRSYTFWQRTQIRCRRVWEAIVGPVNGGYTVTEEVGPEDPRFQTGNRFISSHEYELRRDKSGNIYRLFTGAI